MKKYLFLIMALCCAVVAQAQGTDQFTAILQHDGQAATYKGSAAFKQAYEAAADGDTIYLSQGIFEWLSIEKPLVIYGAGFETIAELNIATTGFNADISVGKADTILSGFHMEGVRVMGNLNINHEMKNCVIKNCRIDNNIRINKNVENMVVKQCRLNAVTGVDTNIADGLFISNCYLSSNVNNFSSQSFIHIDHCLLSRYDSRHANAQIIFTNDIIMGAYATYASVVGQFSTVRNCIAQNSCGYTNNTQVYDSFSVDLPPIFADAETTDYSETRTFELKDPETYKGTDGTPIGPSGGEGWNKVPSKPSIANMSTSVSGANLQVTYTPLVK
ncbi:MAG: hypothetical protein ACI3YA_07170 [Alloprevotella sp.]